MKPRQPTDADRQRAFRFLGRVLHRLTGLPLAELGDLENLFRPRILARGEIFQRAGEQPINNAFVAEGLFRTYYETEDGKEFITNFCRPGHFLGNYSAILRGGPMSLNIEALEDSFILLLPFQSLRGLMREFRAWETFGRRAAENLYLEKEDRERDLLLLSAEERYLLFRKSPLRRMEDRIAHYYIASYLGITPVALSRIRSRLKKSGQL